MFILLTYSHKIKFFISTKEPKFSLILFGSTSSIISSIISNSEKDSIKRFLCSLYFLVPLVKGNPCIFLTLLGIKNNKSSSDITDADALALADVGCAMNIQGADVAKGNADIIISNNNFSSIVDAIKESRGLFANIQKSVFYLFSCNIAELLIYLVGMLIFGAPPLAAVLLLWINLLTDCAPVISLCTERAEDNVMKDKPVTLSGRLFNKRSVTQIALYSVFITVTTLIAFEIGGMTTAFATLALTQILHSFNVKTNRSIINVRLGINDFMTMSTILILFIIFFLVLTPAGSVFGLTILSGADLIWSIVLSVIIIPFGEILKFSRRFIKD